MSGVTPFLYVQQVTHTQRPVRGDTRAWPMLKKAQRFFLQPKRLSVAVKRVFKRIIGDGVYMSLRFFRVLRGFRRCNRRFTFTTFDCKLQKMTLETTAIVVIKNRAHDQGEVIEGSKSRPCFSLFSDHFGHLRSNMSIALRARLLSSNEWSNLLFICRRASRRTCSTDGSVIGAQGRGKLGKRSLSTEMAGSGTVCDWCTCMARQSAHAHGEALCVND